MSIDAPEPVDDEGASSGLKFDNYTRALIALFVGAGVVVCVWVLPEEWSVLRRAAAGVMGGGFCSLCVVANRIIAGH